MIRGTPARQRATSGIEATRTQPVTLSSTSRDHIQCPNSSNHFWFLQYSYTWTTVCSHFTGALISLPTYSVSTVSETGRLKPTSPMRPTDIRKDWSLDYASTIHHIVHQSNEETYQNEVKKVCTECRTAHHMFERTHHQRCAHLITPAQKQVLTNQKTGSSTG
jgi:hypothetical protein